MRPGRENDSRRGRVLFFLYALYFTMRAGDAKTKCCPAV